MVVLLDLAAGQNKYINLALHEVSLTSRNTKCKAICKDLMCEVFVFFATSGGWVLPKPLFFVGLNIKIRKNTRCGAETRF